MPGYATPCPLGADTHSSTLGELEGVFLFTRRGEGNPKITKGCCRTTDVGMHRWCIPTKLSPNIKLCNTPLYVRTRTNAWECPLGIKPDGVSAKDTPS